MQESKSVIMEKFSTRSISDAVNWKFSKVDESQNDHFSLLEWINHFSLLESINHEAQPVTRPGNWFRRMHAEERSADRRCPRASEEAGIGDGRGARRPLHARGNSCHQEGKHGCAVRDVLSAPDGRYSAIQLLGPLELTRVPNPGSASSYAMYVVARGSRPSTLRFVSRKLGITVSVATGSPPWTKIRRTLMTRGKMRIQNTQVFVGFLILRDTGWKEKYEPGRLQQ